MKTSIQIIILLSITSLLSTSAFATMDEGWEMSLTVAVGKAENRVSFGQRPDATDGVDGKYDVPPMLGGAMSASLTGGGASLWRDIRSGDSGDKTWVLQIESDLAKETALLTWNPREIPEGAVLMLRDPVTAVVVDMKTQGQYTFKYSGTREIKIEMKR